MSTERLDKNIVPFQRQTPEEWERSIRSVEGPMHHAVMISYKDEVPQAQVEASLDRLRRLGELPGVLAWAVLPSIDTRKGRVALELGVFTSGAAFLDWRAGEQHGECATELSKIGDWTVADTPLPTAPESQLIAGAIPQLLEARNPKA